VNKIFVVLNPTSGRGGGARAVNGIRQAMRQAGLSFDLYETTRAAEAIDVTREARSHGYAIVAAAGGDGTINEVVNGLVQATPEGEVVGRLALLPVGSGNDFASMIGTPRNLAAAVQAIQTGRTRCVDLGHAQISTSNGTLSRYFDNNVGIGFEAQVNMESRKITRLRGFMIYLMAVFKALRSFDYPELKIEWQDGNGALDQLAQRSLMVSIGNSRRTGGGFYVTPDALMDDGALDMVLVPALKTYQILLLLPRVMIGAHRNHPLLRFTRFASASVASDRAIPVHVDGELLTEDARTLSITLEPKRLEVIV
jgi:diacylglycerol kinase (ATP)